MAEQKRVVASLRSVFPGSSVIDRRKRPSYGYRAVHIIAQNSDKLIEIQIRTYLQHLWAEVSEKISDFSNPATKYGGGNAELQKTLLRLSNNVAKCEKTENDISQSEAQPGYEEQLQKSREQMSLYKKQFVEDFVTVISKLEAAREQKSDLLN